MDRNGFPLNLHAVLEIDWLWARDCSCLANVIHIVCFIRLVIKDLDIEFLFPSLG